MTITQIKEILAGRFESAETRNYWLERLKVEQQKEITGKQNELYFRKNAKYDR